jgi:hypothetical protein
MLTFFTIGNNTLHVIFYTVIRNKNVIIFIKVYIHALTRNSSETINSTFIIKFPAMVRFSAGTTDISILHIVQTGNGAHSTSYPVGTGGFIPWVEAAGA